MLSPFHRSWSFDSVCFRFDLNYLRFIAEVVNYRHPTNLKKKVKLFIRSIIWFKDTQDWFKQIANNDLLKRLVLKQKGLVEKPHKRYLRLNYAIEERTNKLVDHYAIFYNLFDRSSIERIVFQGGLFLTKLETEDNGDFELILSAVDDECKEGELAIRLRRVNGSEISVIRFSFLRSQAGIDLFIAAIQGPKGIGSKEKISEACKALSGLSPNRLVIESCLALAKSLMVDRVLLVSDNQQVFKSKQNKHFNYDAFAQDLGAVLNEEGDYQLPSFIERKRREDTPRKRRAKYQRQHALLDAVFNDVIEVLRLAVRIQGHPVMNLPVQGQDTQELSK